MSYLLCKISYFYIVQYQFFLLKIHTFWSTNYVGVYKTTRYTEDFGDIPAIVFLRFMLYVEYINIINAIRSQFDSDSDMFLYLTNKYMNRLKQLSNRKKSSKKIYQPVCNEYQNTTMRVELKIHQILSDISFTTGYSMSYLIRMMLEWEMQSMENDTNTHRIYVKQTNITTSTVVTKIVINHVYDVVYELVHEHIDFSYG